MEHIIDHSTGDFHFGFPGHGKSASLWCCRESGKPFRAPAIARRKGLAEGYE
jgi:hypothetical protein